MSTTSKTPTKTIAYENNPFFVAVNGLELLFKKAKAIGIALAILAGISMLSSVPSAFVPPTDDAPTTSQQAVQKEDEEIAKNISAVPVTVWVIIAGVVLILVALFMLIGVLVQGVIDYTAAQLANNKEVGFSDALHGVFGSFWGYLWVLVVATVKTLLWSLLFIIPGIIMAYRYSLAGTVYFDKKLKGNGSVKESARLTKNAWLTTFASQSLLNIITLGIVEPLTMPGTQAVLYRQFRALDVAGAPKPAAHILSWLTLIIPIFLVLAVVAIVLAFVAAFS